MTAIHNRNPFAGTRHASRLLAAWSLAVLVFGGVLFASTWLIGGPDATSHNWVGVTTVLALFAGLFGSLAALVMAVVVGRKGQGWSRLWLPLVTFPSVLLAVVLLEALVFE